MTASGSASSREDHQEWEELAVGFALNSLEPEDEHAFAKHLPGCAKCARAVEETREVMAELSYAVSVKEPPASLRAAIVSAIERARSVQGAAEPHDSADSWSRSRSQAPADPAPGVPRPSGDAGGAAVTSLSQWRDRRRIGRLPILAAAASLVLMVALVAQNISLLGNNGELQRQVRTTQAISACSQDSRCTVIPLKSTGDGKTLATALVRQDGAELVVTGMKPNDVETQTYVLWQVLEDGPKLPVRTFDVTGDEPALIRVDDPPAGLAATAAFAVTLEAGRKAPPEGSSPIVVGAVQA